MNITRRRTNLSDSRSTLVLPVVLVGFIGSGGLGCQNGKKAWNHPYPDESSRAAVLYSSFSKRPMHLDPIRSYVSNEYDIIGQVYEPPLQYAYLKRPYQLVPLTAEALPTVHYFDASQMRLSADVRDRDVAFSVYEIKIRSGIRYQPHPAFAKDSYGRYRYHAITDARAIRRLADLKYHGTRELTAEDYVYQLKRMADPKLQCPIFGLMSGYIVGLSNYAERIKSARDELARKGKKGSLDLRKLPHPGVEVVDRYTYRITIHGKYPQFLYWLAMPFFAPMPWEVDRLYARPGMVERNITLDWYPVGTGPFMLTENDPNRRMVLERNPYFHEERYPASGTVSDRKAGLLYDAGKRLPLIDRAVFSLEKEKIPYWNKFLQGYYDASDIASDAFDQAISLTSSTGAELTPGLRDKGIELSTTVETSIWYWAFNMQDSAVGTHSERTRKLRQAISIAIDQEELISIFFNGRGVSAQGPIPPGIFGYRSGRDGINPYVYRWKDGRAQRKTLSEARALLAEAGYPDARDVRTGKPLVLYFDTYATGPDAKPRLDWFRKQFAKLGIQLVVRATDFNRFQEKVRKGAWQMLFWGWNADYPDPENFLFLLHGKNAKISSGGENHANYQSAEYDKRFLQMKHMENGPLRREIIDEMIEIVRRDAPWIPMLYPKAFSLHHRWYRNAKPNLMANNKLKYLRIDPAERERYRREWNRPVFWPIGVVVFMGLLILVPAVVVYRRRERRSAR